MAVCECPTIFRDVPHIPNHSSNSPQCDSSPHFLLSSKTIVKAKHITIRLKMNPILPKKFSYSKMNHSELGKCLTIEHETGCHDKTKTVPLIRVLPHK